MYRRGDAENFVFVCLMVREKIGLQTDRRTDGRTRRIHKSLFSSREKALKMNFSKINNCEFISIMPVMSAYDQLMFPSESRLHTRALLNFVLLTYLLTN